MVCASVSSLENSRSKSVQRTSAASTPLLFIYGHSGVRCLTWTMVLAG